VPDIKIVPPKVTWPNEFKRLATELKRILGSLALRIDHIGSTSVPNLPAKDVIDIQITVDDLGNADLVKRLVDAGFTHRSVVKRDNLVGYSADSKQLEKYFFTEKPGQRRAHIHIRAQGRVNQQYPLLFRDFLIADEMVREAYAKVKIELAARFPNDSGAYYAIKDPYMDTVYRAACFWATREIWECV
jgi:GrpB-like predicted nucleotidyltransferase (UPF0157 family)